MLVVALCAMGGCDGELVPVVREAGNAQAQFESSVRPILSRCSGGSCHSGAGNTPLKFLGEAAQTDDYTAIIGHQSVLGGFNAGSASILTKVTAGGHYNMTYSQGDIDKITAWLSAEAAAKGGAVEPVSLSSLAAWAGCMTIGNWNTVVPGTNTSMGDWANKNSNQGPCQACHNEGAYRFNTNGNSDDMFNMNQAELYVISFITLSTSDTGTVSVVPAYDKLIRMGSNATGHPTYDVGQDDVHFQALAQFDELTRATAAAGDCRPAGFYQP